MLFFTWSLLWPQSWLQLLNERQFVKLALKLVPQTYLHVNSQPAGGQWSASEFSHSRRQPGEWIFLIMDVCLLMHRHLIIVVLSPTVLLIIQSKPDSLELQLDAYGFLTKFGDFVFQEELQLLVEHRLVHHGHSSGAVRQGGCLWYGATRILQVSSQLLPAEEIKLLFKGKDSV